MFNLICNQHQGINQVMIYDTHSAALKPIIGGALSVPVCLIIG